MHGPFSPKATTHSFGNHNSWSAFGSSNAHGLDDFMSGQVAERPDFENDADLLQGRLTTSTVLTTTTKSTTFTSIIAPKHSNSVDFPHLKPETRLFATQQFEKISDSVVLEIQKGQGPFNKSIDSAVKVTFFNFL